MMMVKTETALLLFSIFVNHDVIERYFRVLFTWHRVRVVLITGQSIKI
jgi:hypothetical protein